jgi:hypothetical protein
MDRVFGLWIEDKDAAPSRALRTITIDAFLNKWMTPLDLVKNGDVYET